MFTQAFLFVIGIFSIVMGYREADYVWLIAGIVMSLSGVHLIYQLITGKSLFQKDELDKRSQ